MSMYTYTINVAHARIIFFFFVSVDPVVCAKWYRETKKVFVQRRDSFPMEV